MSQFNKFIKPSISSDDYQILPLAGDASSRRYYRVVCQDKSWVLMEWEPFQDDGTYPFLSVIQYFEKNNIRVPKGHSYSSETGLMLLQDLGDLTLERRFWEFQNQQVILPYYEKALDELIKIHSLSFKDHQDSDCTAYQVEFSVEKLLWELNYAKKYLIQELLSVPLLASMEQKLDEELTSLCDELYQSPQVICHRDFHSRNIMLHFGEVSIIDFQDARMGPPAYDLVSLFHDSYVQLSDESINHLMSYYIRNFPHFRDLGLNADQWQRFYDLQKLQRCFKACGSFASFKVMRDDERYLKYIRPTLDMLMKHMEQTDLTPTLYELLDHNRTGWEQL